ncbi:hypothetical protein Tco_0507526 [Tanacetum coccineum]
MADMVEANQALEERLDKQGSRLYKLENLNIPHQVSKAVDEIVTDAVDCAIQAPLRDRFIDLPKADMKEILYHRMWKSNSYQAHEDHKMLYEALEKKKKKIHASPKTSPGSPPPPPPPAGSSGTPGASRPSQLPPPPPPLYTHQSDPSISTTASSSSKTAASAEYTAWTTTDTRLKPFVLSIPEELHIDDDTTYDEQVQSSGDEDIGHDPIPTVNLRQNWWKPLTEDRPATPEPIWSIPSSNLPVPMNNWASALASTYAPPPENSLLAQTGPDMKLSKSSMPNVNHLQYQSRKCHKRTNAIKHALSISKMKAAYYPDVGLEQMVPDQIHTSEGDRRAVRTHMRILSVVKIEVFSLYGYDYMKKIVLRKVDLKEYTIAERDFKYLYLIDFKDLYLLNLQGHLNHLSPKDKKILTTAVNL